MEVEGCVGNVMKRASGRKDACGRLNVEQEPSE